MEVRLFDKTQGSDPTKREFYWMRTLKTLYPDGLNIENDYGVDVEMGGLPLFLLLHTYSVRGKSEVSFITFFLQSF